MRRVEMPHGGKAWFVRRKRGRHCDLRPASLEGHLLTGGFAAWVGGVAWFFADREVGLPALFSGLAVVLASTILYMVTALRMSAPAPDRSKWR